MREWGLLQLQRKPWGSSHCSWPPQSPAAPPGASAVSPALGPSLPADPQKRSWGLSAILIPGLQNRLLFVWWLNSELLKTTREQSREEKHPQSYCRILISYVQLLSSFLLCAFPVVLRSIRTWGKQVSGRSAVWSPSSLEPRGHSPWGAQK